jgi:hypothetical protein
LIPEIEQHLGDAAHANAANADEVNATVGVKQDLSLFTVQGCRFLVQS